MTDETQNYNDWVFYITAERKEDDEQRCQIAGKARAILEAQATDKDGTAQRRCSREPDWKFVLTWKAAPRDEMTDVIQETVVGNVRKRSCIVRNAEELMKAFSMDVDTAMVELMAFRQQ